MSMQPGDSPQAMARPQRQGTPHGKPRARMQGERVDMLAPLTPHSLLAFSALAHEIKQPLAAILSNAQAAWRFLAMDQLDVAEVRAALDDIIADARRADEVIRGLQAFVTAGSMERTRLDVNDVIREVSQLIRGDAAAQRFTIRLELATHLPPVYGDRIQLRQVVLNLVQNAFEAMGQTEDTARSVVVRTTLETQEVITVAVHDSGTGIDETSLTRLFHPFFTTKAGGMGLGLALSRSIIAAHGGWIWAVRNPDRGITVSFTLPSA